jgi:hypothetical protein
VGASSLVIEFGQGQARLQLPLETALFMGDLDEGFVVN